jgi:ribosomal protein L32
VLFLKEDQPQSVIDQRFCTMAEFIECPECGKRIRKGSTFCLHCGIRIGDDMKPMGSPIVTENTPNTETARVEDLEDKMADMLKQSGVPTTVHSTEAPTSLDAEADVLPDIDDSVLPESKEIARPKEESALEATSLPPADELTWEADSPAPVEEMPIVAADELAAAPAEPESSQEAEVRDYDHVSAEMSWDTSSIPEFSSDEVKEGMPFKEVAPPRVAENDIATSTDEALRHLFPDEINASTTEAVTHLFPRGRGVASRDFVDVVVGKPKKVAITSIMHELKTPSCPNCGTTITGDGYEYPSYVYEAMGKARLEQGVQRQKENEHENAIESFEMAKTLFERAGNPKATFEAQKRIDGGYEAMAASHLTQGEMHFKAGEFEWAAVQFKKAREIFMFTTRGKMRAKCSERIRASYGAWGKAIESDGDRLSKEGRSREALAKYQLAAEKYKEADAPKRLRGLDKKIRKA